MKKVQGLALLASILFASLATIDCSAQGEGARCNAENGDTDCADGLVCKRSAELGGNADICCPTTGVSSSDECVFQGNGGSTASTTPSTGGNGAGPAGGSPPEGGGGAAGGTGGEGGTGGTGGEGGTGGQGGTGGIGGAGGAGGV